MSEYDDLNRALEWHTDRAMEIFCELEDEWPLTTWFVEEGHALYQPQF